MGRDQHEHAGGDRKMVSIHAPRMGRDDNAPYVYLESVAFQFTRPAWGATIFKR